LIDATETPSLYQIHIIRKLLKTTANQCGKVAAQQERLSAYQMKKIRKLLEDTAIYCKAVTGQFSPSMDIVSWTFDRQSFYDQDVPVYSIP